MMKEPPEASVRTAPPIPLYYAVRVKKGELKSGVVIPAGTGWKDVR
jgi:hypothetical protein